MSLGLNTNVLTVDNGYVEVRNLNVGDKLVSLSVDEITTDGPNFDINNWSSEKFTSNGFVETEITNISSTTKFADMFKINNDWFTGNHMILVKKDGICRFLKANEIDTTYEIFDYSEEGWVQIETVESAEDIESTIYSIDCEPYDIFFTEGALVYNIKEYNE